MAEIPVNSSSAYVVLDVTTNGQTVFTFDFRVDEVADIDGIYISPAGISTLLVGGVDFTVSGLKNATGGTITLSSLVTAIGGGMTLFRNIVVSRPNDYIRDVFADDINAEQDRIFMILQEIVRDINRTAKSSLGQAGYIFDDSLQDEDILMISGQNVVKGPNADEITNAQQYSTDAQQYSTDAKTYRDEAEAAKTYVETHLTDFETDLDSKAPLADPVFTGNPQGPTASQFDNDTSLATTAFVQRALGSMRGFGNINATRNLTVNDIGLMYMITGASTLVTTLPPLSDLPEGAAITFKNWSAAAQTISAQGSDLISDTVFEGAGSISLPMGATAHFVAAPSNNLWVLTVVKNSSIDYLPLGGGDIADTQISFTGKIGTIKIDTNFDFTGGIAGYVQSPLRVNAQAQAGVISYIWSVVGVLDNYATAGENVAGYFQGNKRSTGPTWAMVGEAIDRTEAGNPGTGLLALELDLRANGTDGAYQRIGTQYVATKYNSSGADMEVGNGIKFTAESGCKYVNGIDFQANTTYPIRVEGGGTAVVSTSGTAVYNRGIDLSEGAFTDSPLVIPNNKYIKGNDASGNAENLIGLRSDNLLQLGGANNYWTTVTGQVFLPNVDNYSTCGWSDRRWNVIYAATGSINTSDLREKTDREKINGQVALGLLKAVAADDDGVITYRWINGGMEEIDVEETVLVQKTEIVTTSETAIELDANGVPREISKAITTEIAVFEELPVLDENDQPVLVTVPARPAVTKIDDHGIEIVISEARDEYSYPKTFSKPVMVETKQKIKKYIQKEGVRKHAGWGAQVWKRELDNAGLDLGLLVMDDPSDHDSRLSLRPDQTIPFLHAAIVELSSQIDNLKEQITLLKSGN